MVKSSFTGKGKVYRKDTDWGAKYTIQMSKKDMQGNWQNVFMPINFKKGTELQNKQEIELVRCWLDFYVKQDKTVVWQLFCSEFIGGVSQGYDNDETFTPIASEEGDLPF